MNPNIIQTKIPKYFENDEKYDFKYVGYFDQKPSFFFFFFFLDSILLYRSCRVENNIKINDNMLHGFATYSYTLYDTDLWYHTHT